MPVRAPKFCFGTNPSTERKTIQDFQGILHIFFNVVTQQSLITHGLSLYFYWMARIFTREAIYIQAQLHFLPPLLFHRL